MHTLPVIDVGPLVSGASDISLVSSQIRAACVEHGFFYVAGHGIDPELQRRLELAARRFFALPTDEKQRLSMANGGRAWRGWFPVGGELTSGEPDLKEGLYFGAELADDDPRVIAGVPLHGPNLFPAQVPELGPAVLDWMAAQRTLGHALLQGIAEGLGLGRTYFEERWLRDPTTLFRIFRYPPGNDASWGVGEHTDYGLLTLLLQDDVGGLQVRRGDGWIEAPPIAGTFVCNLGDMLERATGGLFRSTPHRVRNVSGRERYSFPFFFDPSWDAEIRALPVPRAGDAAARRWDGADVFAFEGVYGDYLLSKVSKVFPDLARGALPR